MGCGLTGSPVIRAVTASATNLAAVGHEGALGHAGCRRDGVTDDVHARGLHPLPGFKVHADHCEFTLMRGSAMRPASCGGMTSRGSV